MLASAAALLCISWRPKSTLAFCSTAKVALAATSSKCVAACSRAATRDAYSAFSPASFSSSSWIFLSKFCLTEVNWAINFKKVPPSLHSFRYDLKKSVPWNTFVISWNPFGSPAATISAAFSLVMGFLRLGLYGLSDCLTHSKSFLMLLILMLTCSPRPCMTFGVSSNAHNGSRSTCFLTTENAGRALSSQKLCRLSTAPPRNPPSCVATGSVVNSSSNSSSS
mmetsp:Transcript_17578/g.39671  ORF Transcript_17578/g.39671 Transcript_17578/m.39671 type:complete len:223 (-) Transcript_17578:1291-1959(-)